MGRKRIDPRRVKSHRTYTYEEAAQALGVTRNTVRAWTRQGLAVIDDRRPVLIHSAEFQRFLAKRVAIGRCRCSDDELFCLKCREPRRPAEGMADYLPMTATSGNLRGLCPACGTLMHRRVGLHRVLALKDVLEVRVLQAAPDLRDTSNLSPDCAFEEAAEP